MLASVIDSVVHLIESAFSYEVGTIGFNSLLGVCSITWLLVARFLIALFSSKRGIIAVFFTFVVTLGAGLLAYGLAEVQLVPRVEQGWAGSVLPGAAFVLLLLLALLLFGRHIWGLSAGVSIFIYILATAAAVGAYLAAEVTMGVLEFGDEQIEQRDQRDQRIVDELL